MTAFLAGADDILRNRGWAGRSGLTSDVAVRLVLYMVVCSACYGLFMGSYAGVVGNRAWSQQFWQAAFSAAKMPLLLAATFAISLPSFAVLNTLAGLRDDLADVVRALVATQAALAIILISLVPFTCVCYASLGDAAGKAALRSMARTLSRDLLSRGIRVNAVSPGPVDTGILERTMTAEAAEEFKAERVADNPMRRFGTPEEIAGAAAFLAFDATYTAGTELAVDGGYTQL